LIFSSLTFLFAYLPLTLAIYFLAPLRWRNLVLLVVSLFFYGWGEPIYITIMFLSILIDYSHGLLVEKHRNNDKKARYFVAQSIVFNLLLLGFFKYWDFFAANIVEGTIPQTPQEVIISQSVLNRLNLQIGGIVNAYFVSETADVRARRWKIVGVYQTGFEQFDQLFIIAPMETASRLQGWEEKNYSGVEILLSDVSRLDEVADEMYFEVVNKVDENGYNVYYIQTLHQQNPAVFAWLDLLDMNVIVIIILMLLVAGFNIISGLIILIMESVRLIGTLKALGADNHFVRRIFLTQAALLVGKGVVWGNIIGLAIAAIQYFWHIIPLDPITYYVSYVPITFAWGWIILLNVLTIALSMLILLLPSMIITRISPAKVMHFE
jgi:lipoprotein-releasing system permease protein